MKLRELGVIDWLLLAVACFACSRSAQVHEFFRAGPATLEPGGPVPPPDVLLVVLDDFGWPEVPLMPTLADFAAEGVTFRRAYSWPTCSCTRIAYRFGRYPRREGAGDLSFNAHQPTQDRLRLNLFSMGELFAPFGTSMLFGKWHLGRAPLQGELDQVPTGPYCQGYQWRAGSPSVLNASGQGYYSWQRVTAGDMALSTQYATDAQREEFVSWWTTTSGFRFCELSFSAPHAPYDAPPGYGIGATTRERYEQVIEYLDTQLALALAQVGPDTVVVITTDNGTPDDARPTGTDSGIWKGSVSEGGVRVPLFIRGPGIDVGATSDRLVSLVDLGATLAEVAGVALPGGFEDSRSFADELGTWEGELARSFVFTERWEVTQSGQTIPQLPGYDAQAVIEPGWKLTRINAVNTYWRIDAPGVEVPLVPGQVIQDRLQSELEDFNLTIPRQ